MQRRLAGHCNDFGPSRWVVLASGPSLTVEDVTAVKGRALVCCVNNTHELAPWANVLYASDQGWWRRYYKDTKQFEGEKLTCGHTEKAVPFADVERVPHISGEGYGLATGLPFYTGQNSGHAAINIVRALYGATSIALLGFDFQRTNGEVHYFGLHHGMTNPGPGFPRWAKHMATLAKDAKAQGVQIVNCSRETALTCFDRMTINEWLERNA